MFTKICAVTTKRSLTSLLLFAIMLMAMSCAPPAIDEWVQHDNSKVDNPAMLYYVLEARGEGGKSIGLSSTTDTDECLLLQLDRTELVDPHGNHHYAARSAAETIWDRCWDYYNVDKPTLVITKIPKEFAEQMRIEIPKFIFEE